MAITYSDTTRKPRKKALLIGIKYKELNKLDQEQRPGQEPTGILKGAHKNVKHVKKLLIGTFGFLERDIVMMLDKDDYDNKLVPTQANIRREINSLVDGAREGDHFFFTYSGHADQQDAVPDGHEEDGRDEVIIASDGKRLVDNELKQTLPDALPLGSHLIVLWDTCHSGTLLDLPHYHCNKIPDQNNPDQKSAPRPSKLPKFMVEHAAARHRSQATSGYSHQTFVSRAASLNVPRHPYGQPPALPHSSTLWVSPEPPGGPEGANSSSQECASPVAESSSILSPWSREPRTSHPAVFGCTGKCRRPTFLDTASVISISACRDDQSAWEYPNGDSLTEFFVKAMESNPDQSVRELVEDLHKEVENLTKARHSAMASRGYHEKASPCTCHLNHDSDTDSDEDQNILISSYVPVDYNESVKTYITD